MSVRPEPNGMILVREVRLAVANQGDRGIEFDLDAEVLDAHLLDSIGIVVLDQFRAAPPAFDGTGERRVVLALREGGQCRRF